MEQKSIKELIKGLSWNLHKNNQLLEQLIYALEDTVVLEGEDGEKFIKDYFNNN